MNKRVLFFLIAAALCLVLAPVTQDKFRWVPEVLGGVYVVLAVLAALDSLGSRRR